MKINSIQHSCAQNFGATPDKAFLAYIGSKLPTRNQKNLAAESCRILDQLTEIRNLHGEKTLVLRPANRRIASLELGDVYLTSIDKTEPIIANLDKVIQTLKGRERYTQIQAKLAPQVNNQGTNHAIKQRK